MVQSPTPYPPPPPNPRQSMGKPTKKKPWLSVFISMYSHTFFSNPNTKPIIETVGKRHFGSQGPKQGVKTYSSGNNDAPSISKYGM